MYLKWSSPIYYPDSLIGSYAKESGSYSNPNDNFDYLSLCSGDLFSLTMDKPSIYFKSSSLKVIQYDLLWLLGGYILVSEKFANFLITYIPQQIELIKPSGIFTSNDVTIDNYFLLNIINKVHAVDKEVSTFTLSDDNHVLYYNTYWFKDYPLNEFLVSRDLDSFDILISKSFADKLLVSNFKVCKDFGFYKMDGHLVPYK